MKKRAEIFDESKVQYQKLCEKSLLIYCELKSQSIALLVHELSNVESEISHLNSLYNLNNSRIKLIGPHSFIERAQTYLVNFNTAVSGEIVREKFEFIFIPKKQELLLDIEETAERQDTTVFYQRKIRILIVDDSKSVRAVLRKAFESNDEVEVVGEVEDPREILKSIEATKPDIISLDLQMPHLNGIETLKKYIDKYPIPTLIVSALSINEGHMVLDALAAGAVEYIQKPTFQELEKFKAFVLAKIKEFAGVKIERKLIPKKIITLDFTSNQNKYIWAIGSSTGGTEALKEILTALPPNIPPVLIVQHMPPVFSKALAERLNGLCPFEVLEGEDGMLIKRNRVIIAPGGKQMKTVVNKSGQFQIEIRDGPPMNHHKPSVDVLFNSVADTFGKKAIGVMLTGMGADGSTGMLRMKKAGSFNIAQDEKSCVIFGMPQAAINKGGVDVVCSLSDIPLKLHEIMNHKIKKAI